MGPFAFSRKINVGFVGYRIAKVMIKYIIAYAWNIENILHVLHMFIYQLFKPDLMREN